MALTINHQTNDISATSGSMTIDGAAVGGGGSYTLPTASGSTLGGIKIGSGLSIDGSGVVTASGGGGGGADLYAANESSPSAQPSATGTNSIAIGESAVSTGRRSLAVGTSRAAGNYSVAMMIGSNSTSYGTYGGSRNLAMGELARSTFGSYALGAQARAEGEKSYVIGTESTAVRKRSMAFGYQSQPASEDTLSFAGGQFSSKGDGQRSFAALRCSTTNATPATLTTNDNGAVSSNNQIILPNNSAFVFTGALIAREQASSGTDVGAWKVEGTIRREGSAGTTTLIHNTVTAIGTAPSGWSLAITADTTYGAAKFAVTGAASTNIRWVLKLDTAEVSYA